MQENAEPTTSRKESGGGNKKATLEGGFFSHWWGRQELAILASQCVCMRIGVRGLAAMLLEFPSHPAPVPDAVPCNFNQ